MQKKISISAFKDFIVGGEGDRKLLEADCFENIACLRELFKRCIQHRLLKKKPLARAKLIDYILFSMQGLKVESAKVLLLDIENNIIDEQPMCVGTVDHVAIYPREIMKACITFNAKGIILCHNHPSGSPKPSLEDCKLTWCLKKALRIIDVRLHDHIIVARGSYYSFLEEGQLCEEVPGHKPFLKKNVCGHYTSF